MVTSWPAAAVCLLLQHSLAFSKGLEEVLAAQQGHDGVSLSCCSSAAHSIDHRCCLEEVLAASAGTHLQPSNPHDNSM